MCIGSLYVETKLDVAWNALTKSVVTSSTLDAFKAALPLGRAGLNDWLFSETMDFRDFPSVLSAVRIAQSWYLAHSLPIV